MMHALVMSLLEKNELIFISNTYKFYLFCERIESFYIVRYLLRYPF